MSATERAAERVELRAEVRRLQVMFTACEERETQQRQRAKTAERALLCASDALRVVEEESEEPIIREFAKRWMKEARAALAPATPAETPVSGPDSAQRWRDANPQEVAKYAGLQIAIHPVLGIVGSGKTYGEVKCMVADKGLLGEVVFDGVEGDPPETPAPSAWAKQLKSDLAKKAETPAPTEFTVTLPTSYKEVETPAPHHELLRRYREERDRLRAELATKDEEIARRHRDSEDYLWAVKRLCSAAGLSAPHEGREKFRAEIEDRASTSIVKTHDFIALRSDNESAHARLGRAVAALDSIAVKRRQRNPGDGFHADCQLCGRTWDDNGRSDAHAPDCILADDESKAAGETWVAMEAVYEAVKAFLVLTKSNGFGLDFKLDNALAKVDAQRRDGQMPLYTWCKPPGSGKDSCEASGRCMSCNGTGRGDS